MAKKDSIDGLIEEPVVGAELTPDEINEIRAQARAEVAKEMLAAKKKALLEAEKVKAKRQALFSEGKDDTGEDLVTVHLELFSYPRWVMLDGRRYHSGKKYTVKKSIAQVLLDQMYRGERAEASRLGENTNEFVRRQMVVGRNAVSRPYELQAFNN